MEAYYDKQINPQQPRPNREERAENHARLIFGNTWMANMPGW